MRAFLLIFSTLVLGVLSTHAFGGSRDRVVSTSLCGDSYVLGLVPKSSIAALSWQSDDILSAAPISMRGRPKAWDDPERLLALTPTLVVFGAGEGHISKPILGKAGISYLNIEWGEDFASIRNNETALAKAAHLKPPRRELPQQLSRHPPTVLYLSSAGATAGPGTYIDEVIRTAGGENIITKPGWHTPDPENFVILKPDLIITSFFKDGYASVNETGLRNKVLQDKIKSTPHINIPGKLWPCAGPGLYEATNRIADAIAGLAK